MVKELAGQDVAGLAKIPLPARKHKIRLVEVSEANFMQAAKVTEACAPFPEIKHDVAFRALVENQGYPQKLLEIEAPLRDALTSLDGEYLIDNGKILSYKRSLKEDSQDELTRSPYKKVNAGDVAGLLDLPEEVRDMQLVLHTDSLALTDKDSEEEWIDLIAIIKENKQTLPVGSDNELQEIKTGEWTSIK